MQWQLLTVVLAVAAPAPAEDKRKDEEKLQGTWVAVSSEYDGKKAPEKFRECKAVIKDDTYTLIMGGHRLASKFTVDPKKKPKAIDITFDVANVPGRKGTKLGIYELDGDTLKVCTSFPTRERPTEFATKEGSLQILIVFRREKKKE